MNYLFFDVETTGLPQKGMRPSDPNAPHIIQLCAVLCTDSLAPFQKIMMYVKPDGWDITPEITQITGITKEVCKSKGYAERHVISSFLEMAKVSDMIVAHNIRFDMFMIRAACKRYGFESPKKELFCTMESSRNILQLPPTKRMMDVGIDAYKAPKLDEAYRFFLGKDIENAHDARADTMACLEVFKQIKLLQEGNKE